MGLETIAILGLSMFQANRAMKQGEAEAKAVVEQADIENKERVKRTRALAAAQKVSFLNSGLTLEGTPMAAIQETFRTGIEDVELASRNAERTAKNIQRKARSEAISTLVQAGEKADFGGAFSGSGVFGSQGAVSRQVAFGSTKVQGPIQGFGGFDIAGGLRRSS